MTNPQVLIIKSIWHDDKSTGTHNKFKMKWYWYSHTLQLTWYATYQGGRKRCSTVALLRGTKAKREAQRLRGRHKGGKEKRKGGKEEQRRRTGREEEEKIRRARGREGEKEWEREKGSEVGRKEEIEEKTELQASKKRCSMVVPLGVQRTRGRHNEGGQKR